MTPEEHYKEVVKLDMDKFDKKTPKFDYYDLLNFADSYHKKQLTLTDVSQQRELFSDLITKLKEENMCSHAGDELINNYFDLLNCG